MGILELFLVAVGLSMDAFAVAVCKGLAVKEVRPRHMALTGLWFGGFQALMPVIGYFIGAQFKDAIASIDHWIAFGLLAVIGGNMVREALSKEEEPADASMSPGKMFPLAVATSIDALAVGVGASLMGLPLVLSCAVIGATAFVLSFLGAVVGRKLGQGFQTWAQVAGGAVLIGIGLKFLLERFFT